MDVEFGVVEWVVGTVGRAFSFNSSILESVLEPASSMEEPGIEVMFDVPVLVPVLVPKLESLMFSLEAGASPAGRRGRTFVLSRTDSVSFVDAEVDGSVGHH